MLVLVHLLMVLRGGGGVNLLVSEVCQTMVLSQMVLLQCGCVPIVLPLELLTSRCLAGTGAHALHSLANTAA